MSIDGRIEIAKVSSTPDAPARGVVEAMRQLFEGGVRLADEVGRIAHGSTVATNALLEGKWAKTALVTTRGFRDVLEIGRQNRPALYDLFYERAALLVPRDLRYEVTERIGPRGETVIAIDRHEVEDLARALRGERIEAIAVVFLFSYLNPAHERLVREVLRNHLEIPVVLSSDVLPEFREYERTSTTAVSAALRPIVGEYLTDLEAGASACGLPATWQIMQSSGAVTSAALAQHQPARILLSGPAAGVEGARIIGGLAGEPNLITMDMGGTSCDVSLIHQEKIGWTTGGNVGGHPVSLPMVDIHTIGAGGGSLAWIDSGGALRVGPQSAGADPGPACYGRGGAAPTVTDAHVVLGHLLAADGLGELDTLDGEAAKRAVSTVGERLGLSAEQTALGILEVADAAMEGAIRVISVEQGYDPRDFALLAFGGAGPLHAVSIARRLGIPRVLIPLAAGVLSAFGLLAAPVGHDTSQSLVRPLRDVAPDELLSVWRRLADAGQAALESEGVPSEGIRHEPAADLRYIGQSHELRIEMDAGDIEAADEATLERLADRFHAAHSARFGHAAPDDGVEFVTARVRSSAPAHPLDLRRQPRDAERPLGAVRAWFSEDGGIDVSVFDRETLPPGAIVCGPCILVGRDATAVIPEGCSGTCDAYGNVMLEVR